jgi:hypothetical protein
MKKLVIAGTLAVAVAMAGTVLAQQPAQTAPESPAKAAKTHAKKSDQGETAGAHTAPKQQPNTAEAANATSQQPIPLGTVRIPRATKADGKELPAGTYQVRLTTEAAKGDARGATDGLERWAEFMKGGQVVGRELVTIVPANEAHLVVKDAAPPAGGSKVQELRGGGYTRVWFNRAGTIYLVHLVNG